MPQFTGRVEFKANDGFIRAVLDPDLNNTATLELGLGPGNQPGSVVLRDGTQQIGVPVIWLEAGTGEVRIGNDGTGGRLRIRDNGGTDVLVFDSTTARLYLGATSREGDLIVKDNAAREVIHLDGASAAIYVGTTGNEGDVIVRDTAARDVIHLDGASAAIYVGTTGNEGDVIVRDTANRQVIKLDGGDAAVTIGVAGNDGELVIRGANGSESLKVDGDTAHLYVGAPLNPFNAGTISVRNGMGQTTIQLNGATGIITSANADCAEEFDVADPDAIEPGTVMVLVEGGSLRQSTDAYDTKVAGVISGAGELRPGLVLNKQESSTRRLPLALIGRVMCKVDASFGSIAAGDLLTTSATPGHAMKAGIPSRAFGAVLGKALHPLKQGRGLIPVLVALH